VSLVEAGACNRTSVPAAVLSGTADTAPRPRDHYIRTIAETGRMARPLQPHARSRMPALIVLGPVENAPLRPRDAMTASCIGFMQHFIDRD